MVARKRVSNHREPGASLISLRAMLRASGEPATIASRLLDDKYSRFSAPINPNVRPHLTKSASNVMSLVHRSGG